ncbi:MAG: type III toxin-antitoxin system ToxN/AbiQ family toxin [Clostridia bacterium]|nr:type III toxin-antitoxin system ToxN/AbiQ family toxin [Clostridia bacterium]
MKRFKIVRVKPEYCDYLRQFDKKVPFNKDTKELRPFIGVLFEVNGCEFFAPLSSPKKKHIEMKNSIDFYKIERGELGAINFNNMIPVNKDNYILINLNINFSTDSINEIKYKKMILKQLIYMNNNYDIIKNKVQKLYEAYKTNRINQTIKSRCCDFLLLEQKCKNYNN